LYLWRFIDPPPRDSIYRQKHEDKCTCVTWAITMYPFSKYTIAQENTIFTFVRLNGHPTKADVPKWTNCWQVAQKQWHRHYSFGAHTMCQYKVFKSWLCFKGNEHFFLDPFSSHLSIGLLTTLSKKINQAKLLMTT